MDFEKIKIDKIMFFVFSSFSVSTIYFWETFDSDAWKSRWIVGQKPKRGPPLGDFDVSAGSLYIDKKQQRGLIAIDDDSMYIISARFDKPFNTSGRDLIFQYMVKNEGKIGTGSTKLKLFGNNFRPNTYNPKSFYEISFGQDFHDWDRHHVEFKIMRNRSEYISTKPLITFHDQLTHLYTLIIFANQTYQIRMDNWVDREATLEEDFNYCNPQFVEDPFDEKPKDWVDQAEIDDPNDLPPEEWRDIPRLIPNPNAKKPALWNDETDGVWERPLVPNPEFLIDWKPKRIKNPAFKGDWKPRIIENPEYNPDPKFGKPEKLMYVGMDNYIDKAATIWDNILVTDDMGVMDDKIEEFYYSIQNPERQYLVKKLDEQDKKGKNKEL